MVKIDQVVTVICHALPDIKAIYLFGSADSKYERLDSDIDLAILPDKKLDSVVRWELSGELARLLKRDVDLIDLSQTSTVLQFQIINAGKCIYCRDKKGCEAFASAVYAMYIRFNDERREVLDEIKKRGKIYD